MSCLQVFCDRLDERPGDHACELSLGHVEACRCECDACLGLAPFGTLPSARAALVTS